MLEVLEKLRDGIIDILLPKVCIGCGQEGAYICKDCEVFLSEVPPSGVMSVWEYEGLMKKLIRKIKLNGHYHIIDELVKRALGRVELELPEDTYITYVPMYPRKERKRGFNQSELIARKMGGMLQRKVLPLLTKTADSHPQDGLPPELRMVNVENKFSFSGSFAPENVLLVDDYYVTGATANECSKVLRTEGVKNVWIFALACQLSW